MPSTEVLSMLVLVCTYPGYLEDYFVYLETLMKRKPASLYTFTGVLKLSISHHHVN
jgi:hypothetical protein